MNCIKSIAKDIRPKGKCSLNIGSLFFILLLLSIEISSRPPDEINENIKIEDEYPEADNIEWHNVKLVNGVFQADHPIIMYKEDFVNENYNKKVQAPKKYKDLSKYHRYKNRGSLKKSESYEVIKPEKLYFDEIPKTPIMSLNSDEKLDSSEIQAELIPLVDDFQFSSASSSEIKKDNDSKVHKESNTQESEKNHSRVRRQANENFHKVTKRNPFYYYHQGYYHNFVDPRYNQIPCHRQQTRLPVQGNREPAGVEVAQRFFFPENDDNIDRAIFPPSNQISFEPGPTRRPIISGTSKPILDLHHDSNPNNADFSGFHQVSGNERRLSNFAPSPPMQAPSVQQRPLRPSNRIIPEQSFFQRRDENPFIAPARPVHDRPTSFSNQQRRNERPSSFSSSRRTNNNPMIQFPSSNNERTSVSFAQQGGTNRQNSPAGDRRQIQIADIFFPSENVSELNAECRRAKNYCCILNERRQTQDCLERHRCFLPMYEVMNMCRQ